MGLLKSNCLRACLLPAPRRMCEEFLRWDAKLCCWQQWYLNLTFRRRLKIVLSWQSQSPCVCWGVGFCACAADLYTHKLLRDGSKYRPHLVLLGGSSGWQKGRGHCSSQVEQPHWLSCSWRISAMVFASWRATFLVGLEVGIGVVLTFWNLLMIRVPLTPSSHLPGQEGPQCPVAGLLQRGPVLLSGGHRPLDNSNEHITEP